MLNPTLSCSPLPPHAHPPAPCARGWRRLQGTRMPQSAADIHKGVVACHFHRCERVAGTQLRTKLAKLVQPLQQIGQPERWPWLSRVGSLMAFPHERFVPLRTGTASIKAELVLFPVRIEPYLQRCTIASTIPRRSPSKMWLPPNPRRTCGPSLPTMLQTCAPVPPPQAPSSWFGLRCPAGHNCCDLRGAAVVL